MDNLTQYTLTIDPTLLGIIAGSLVGTLGLIWFMWTWVSKLSQTGSSNFYLGGLIVFFVLFAAQGFTYCHFSSKFDSSVTSHILAAYNASSLEESNLQFGRAVSYLKDNNITAGSTGTLYKYPEYNVEDWFKKIEKAETELAKLNADAAPSKEIDIAGRILRTRSSWQSVLENTGVVQTSTSVNRDGSGAVTKASFAYPAGLPNYPFNGLMALWVLGAGFGVLANFFAFLYQIKDHF